MLPLLHKYYWSEGILNRDKNAIRLLFRNYVNRRGLDLSKEVLWVSVDQIVAELPAVKDGGKKNSAAWLDSKPTHPRQGEQQNFFQTSNFDGW